MHRRVGLSGLLFVAALGGCFGPGNQPSAPGPDGSTGIEFGDSGFPDGGPTADAPSGDAAMPVPSVTIGAGPTLDFGMIACGAPAPARQTFSITNSGKASVHYALALSATNAFQLSGATSGDVAPAASATVTLAVSAEPTSATAGAVDHATLTITTDDPAHASVPIALQRTAQGATLTLSPATAALADIPVGASSKALPLALKNTGNLAASVTLGPPSDTQFSLTWTGASSAPVSLAAGAAVPGLSAMFSPTAAGPATATSKLTVSGAVCGQSVSAIPYSGNGTKGVVGVTPGMLDFGLVNCGAAAAAAQTVTVTNSGNADFTYTAVLLLGASSPFAVSPPTGLVKAGTSAVVTVTPAAIPQIASVAANAFGDTLRVTSDAVGDANHDVALTETAQGAVLSVGATSLPFNNVTLGQSPSLPFSIQNTGNLPATVTIGGAVAPFGVSPAGGMLTVGGSPLAATATFAPTVLGGASGSITLASTDVQCSAPLPSIQLTGNGVNGVLSLGTTLLDFTSVPCGQAAGKQTFTVANTGTASFSWTATLGKSPSPYTVAPASGTLAPGAPPTTVTVTPAAIPFPSAITANLYGDVITITPTGIGGGAPQTVTLKETAEGAIVTASPSPLPSFGNQQEGQSTAAATLTLQNNGTMPVSITPTLGGANPSAFALTSPGTTVLAASGSYSLGPKFAPTTGGALSAQVSLAQGSGDVLCQPLPGPLALAGTGTNGAVTLGAGSVTFPAQTCGAAAGLTQTVQLTNSGTAALTFNAVVLGSTGFQVTPGSGSLAAGANVLLTVTSPTFSTSTGNVTAVTDTLRVTTSAYKDGNHDLPLSSTPSGAMLAWVTAPLVFGTTQATSNASKSTPLPFSVKNGGNVAATVTFATQGKEQYTFAPQNSAVPAAGALPGTATFTPTASGLQSDAVVLSVAGGTPLCAPLPAALGLSGTGAQGAYQSSLKLLNFPLTCNTAGVPQSFNITNNGGAEPYDFTVAIGAGYAVSPASGTVAVNDLVKITVTPPTEGAATPGATDNVQVTVTTDLPGDTAQAYAVNGTVTGAELGFVSLKGAPQPTLAFGSQVATGTATTTLENTGNAAETVDYLVTADPGNVDTDPTLLLVTWGGTASVGGNTVTYGFNGTVNLPCGITMKYTVTFPNKTVAGVCGAATQVVTVTPSNGC